MNGERVRLVAWVKRKLGTMDLPIDLLNEGGKATVGGILINLNVRDIAEIPKNKALIASENLQYYDIYDALEDLDDFVIFHIGKNIEAEVNMNG